LNVCTPGGEVLAAEPPAGTPLRRVACWELSKVLAS
jgi:hypothetical protein